MLIVVVLVQVQVALHPFVLPENAFDIVSVIVFVPVVE
jgi:hypothetical protein